MGQRPLDRRPQRTFGWPAEGFQARPSFPRASFPEPQMNRTFGSRSGRVGYKHSRQCSGGAEQGPRQGRAGCNVPSSRIDRGRKRAYATSGPARLEHLADGGGFAFARFASITLPAPIPKARERAEAPNDGRPSRNAWKSRPRAGRRRPFQCPRRQENPLCPLCRHGPPAQGHRRHPDWP